MVGFQSKMTESKCREFNNIAEQIGNGKGKRRQPEKDENLKKSETDNAALRLQKFPLDVTIAVLLINVH